MEGNQPRGDLWADREKDGTASQPGIVQRPTAEPTLFEQRLGRVVRPGEQPTEPLALILESSIPEDWTSLHAIIKEFGMTEKEVRERLAAIASELEEHPVVGIGEGGRQEHFYGPQTLEALRQSFDKGAATEGLDQDSTE